MIKITYLVNEASTQTVIIFARSPSYRLDMMIICLVNCSNNKTHLSDQEIIWMIDIKNIKTII